jgi:hypothetical protein
MRNTLLLPALGVALLAGTSLASAQTVETVVGPAPAPVVIAQDPVLVTEPAPVIETVPVQTTETVRTEHLTTRPARRVARGPAPRLPQPDAVTTTTRTTVRESIAPAPLTAPVAAIAPPTYTEVVQAPPAAYPGPLYDYVAAGAGPPAAVVEPPLPAYRYVYQPDRILVIDANTGVTVQALPR